MNPVILVAIIGLIGTLISAVLSSPILLEKMQNSSAPTEANSAPMPVSTSADEDPFFPETGNSTHQVENAFVYLPQWDHSSDFDSIKSIVLLEEPFNPATNPEDALDEILKNVQNDQIRYWSQISSSLTLTLTAQNIQTENGLDIKIDNVATVRVYGYQPIAAHANAVVERGMYIPVSGGETNFYFEPVMVDALHLGNPAITTTLMEYDSVVLKPGEIGTFEFSLTCKSPGIYVLAVIFQTFYGGESKDIEVPAPEPLVCPESLTIWDYQDDSGNTVRYEWRQVGDYVLEEGHYKSVDKATATPDQ